MKQRSYCLQYEGNLYKGLKKEERVNVRSSWRAFCGQNAEYCEIAGKH